ncbi:MULTISPECIES: hypothetical protein [Pseudanabaena]|uniref:hypothetical protein n=1 Tax=Pseudanabaena TaxID=1152 RepID=UPI0024791713|nr:MULTISPECIES: hypothetical protein [Pseudanabaena]MEA5489186.1 hypothetical protein [Pseudanabaena sp. CCNP1317]WGS73771.1 hypothetical protein OA858_06995 [Pseudanabaena galeata CCNP1313]
MFTEDVAINALSRSKFSGGDTAISKLNSAEKNVSIQVHQAEFDWITNINAFQRLKHLITLKDNWDGYGAAGFSRQHIQRALDLFAVTQCYFNAHNLRFSLLSPFIAPCSDGAILFEWCGRRFPDRQLEIFIPVDLEQPFEYLKSDHESDEDGNFTDVDFVISLLEWLMETGVE